MGIIRLGSIGQEVARRSSTFGVDLKWWGPRAKPDVDIFYVRALADLADQCRGVIVCCRPDASTHHLINEKILARLGPEGVLVNVSRGGVLDEDALIAALKSNRLGGSGLDVFDPEPTSDKRWSQVPNVILTPHQGGNTYEALFAQAQVAQSNIESFLDGRALPPSVL